MTAHSVTHEEERRPPSARAGRNGLLLLGWPHFWLLTGILGGMLGLVALVYFVELGSH